MNSDDIGIHRKRNGLSAGSEEMITGALVGGMRTMRLAACGR